MSGHTKGQWSFNPATGTVSTSGGQSVCYVSTIGTRPDAFEVAKANGFVLAAAPELLAALRAVISVADRKTDEFDLARAAIAKAIGAPL